MNSYLYQVAGHKFRIVFPDKFSGIDPANCAPFRLTDETGESDESLFQLSVTDRLPDEKTYGQVGKFDDDIASIDIFKSANGDFRFNLAYPASCGKHDCCTMDTDAGFSKAQAVLPENPQSQYFFLNNCLMLLYAFATARFDTLLLHASVIKNAGEGFVFLGRSGTGKSTHSSLWLKHIAGSELLNDDNPVIRIIDGRAYVFGSPWSGKTACYKNDGVPLKSIVKLRQAPENRITKLSVLQAYAAVLPACSSMRWENELMTDIHRAVEKLATGVACYQLDCLPDRAAAELCFTTISTQK